MSKKICKGDTVVVIAGDQGDLSIEKRTGKVKSVDRKKSRLIVEGINLTKVSLKRTSQNPQGGIVEKECPIHTSNVMLKEKYDLKRKTREKSKSK